MNFKQAAISIAAITLLAGGPAMALANTDALGAPIDVTSVQTKSTDVPGAASEFGGYSTHSYVAISVTFHNTRNVAVTGVTFDVISNGATIGQITDTGTFAPGVTISHQYDTNSNAANQQLTVASVKFADGTTWVNSSRPLRQTGS